MLCFSNALPNYFNLIAVANSLFIKLQSFLVNGQANYYHINSISLDSIIHLNGDNVGRNVSLVIGIVALATYPKLDLVLTYSSEL